MPVVVRTRAYDENFYKEIEDTDWREKSDQEVADQAKIVRTEIF